MPEYIGDDLTLPSVVAPRTGEASEYELTLTIIFHPVTARIGEVACVEPSREAEPRMLGRHAPAFGRRGGKNSMGALNDPYISRKALQLSYEGDAVVLSRNQSSSRCRVENTELSGELRLSGAQLSVGVPLLLAARVVLLLRRTLKTKCLEKPFTFGEAMIGGSAYMGRLKAQIARLAGTDMDVLIRGETGTGKELVAQAIHAASKQSAAKMVTVNMAAIPADLAPAALFGSAKGAFTGANKAGVGYFEQAEGGILFLDEIGDTPPEIQAQLLRVLQQREIQIVGGPVRTVDLRVISATDAPLDESSCNFKDALRHRLAESEIMLLPLREHPEDIGELSWVFIQTGMNSLGRSHILPRESSGADEVSRWADLFHQFLIYTWPGNIRELRNFSRQLAVVSESSVTIPDAVRECIALSESVSEAGNTVSVKAEAPEPVNYSDTDFMAGYENARYEVAKAARQLGISRQAVYRYISDSPDLCLANELPIEKINLALNRSEGDLGLAATDLKVSRSALRERIRNSHVNRAS